MEPDRRAKIEELWSQPEALGRYLTEYDTDDGRDIPILRLLLDASEERDRLAAKCEALTAALAAEDGATLGGMIERQSENAALRERIDRLAAALRDIDEWADAYPVDIFPEPDLNRAADVLKAAGMTLDAISASNMRHVLSGVKRIVQAAKDAGDGGGK